MTNAIKAAKHLKRIKEVYVDSISKSIRNTTIHRIDVDFNKPKEYVLNVKLVNTNSVSAVFDYAKGKTAVLNFASYKNPGGGFLGGSISQEEALCHESTLYPVISAQTDYYEYNKKLINKGLYTDAALYSEDIVFIRDNKEMQCDVITCACPNWGSARRNKVSPMDNYKALKHRIEFMLKVAASHNVDTLILGAWGCGVFKQDSSEVAEVFQNMIEDYPYFKTIVFAIPGGENYNIFRQVFK